MDKKRLTSLSLSKTSLLNWSFSDMRVSITELCSFFWLFSLSMMLLKWLRFSSSLAIIARSSLFTSLKTEKNHKQYEEERSGLQCIPHSWLVYPLRERQTALLLLPNLNLMLITVGLCLFKPPDTKFEL